MRTNNIKELSEKALNNELELRSHGAAKGYVGKKADESGGLWSVKTDKRNGKRYLVRLYGSVNGSTNYCYRKTWWL